ncbi:MAG: helix-turn-helix domain-containing protein [Candidatus Aenigmatarchaeota archaeon]
MSQKEKTEHVFVPLSELEDFDTTQSVASMRIEWEIIQKLKKLRGQEQHLDETLPTLEEAEKMVIKDHLERHRPEMKYAEMAKRLGIASKTLWQKRRKYNLP